jgi:hypothetical protein
VIRDEGDSHARGWRAAGWRFSRLESRLFGLRRRYWILKTRFGGIRRRTRSLKRGFRRLKKRFLVRVGVEQWGTKSFEFWTLLVVLLALVRPKSIVELGSGRSTSYLTEYAMKKGARYASIEQNAFYVAKIKRGLRNSFLGDRYVHHVPIARDGWYEAEALDRVAAFPCELLFVDGPAGPAALQRATRLNERSLRWLKAAAASSKVVIVDDVHRRSILTLFRELVPTTDRLSTLYLSYDVRPIPNVIAIAVVPSAYAALTRLCAELGLPVFTEYSIGQCTEP